jgi:uncharacterized protein YebE (UPF0316 family)
MLSRQYLTRIFNTACNLGKGNIITVRRDKIAVINHRPERYLSAITSYFEITTSVYLLYLASKNISIFEVFAIAIVFSISKIITSLLSVSTSHNNYQLVYQSKDASRYKKLLETMM